MWFSEIMVVKQMAKILVRRRSYCSIIHVWIFIHPRARIPFPVCPRLAFTKRPEGPDRGMTSFFLPHPFIYPLGSAKVSLKLLQYIFLFPMLNNIRSAGMSEFGPFLFILNKEFYGVC